MTDSRVDLDRAASVPDDWSEALHHIREAHRAGGRINYIGGPADSITEGTGATRRESSWWSLFAQDMNAALGQPSRAIGSAEVTVRSLFSPWTCTGPAPKDTHRSLGRYGVALLRGSVLSTTQGCDRLRLLYDRTSASLMRMHGGRLDVRIDGESVAQLECGGSDVVGLQWDSGPLGEFRERRIDLECIDGDFASIGHAYFHDGADGDTGPLFWRNARHVFDGGRGSTGFANETSTWPACMTTRSLWTNPVNDEPIAGGGTIAADCFLCCTGTNDVLVLDNDRDRLTASTIELIRYLRNYVDGDPSIGIIVPTSSKRYDCSLQNLRDATRTACEEEGAFMIDLWTALGTHGDDRDGFFVDGVHPNDRGHRAWADYVSAWMLAAVQSA